MAQDIEYALREAHSMQLSREQSIRFVMRMADVDRTTASNAVNGFSIRIMQAH